MKIAIITFNRAVNYGAVLQSLALKKTVESYGYECEVINYKCEMVEKVASPFYINSFSLKDILIFLLQIKMRICKNKKFSEFSKKYLDTDKKILDSLTIEEISDSYDVYITGSDQVWNYEITGLDKNYFLDFASKEKCRVSYAASFGVAQIPENMKNNYKELLSNIENISVREEEGAKIVKELTGKDAALCIDPVFLLNKEEWSKYVDEPNILSDYILVYSINKTDCYKIAEEIAAQTNCKIVGLQVPLSTRTKCTRIQTESPAEYLGWFYNAKYVVTDSFHGTAFSAIFEKKFIVCVGGQAGKRFSRQRTLLSTLKLENRICTAKDYQKIYHEIDYSKVRTSIEEANKASMEYLDSVLNIEKN